MVGSFVRPTVKAPVQSWVFTVGACFSVRCSSTDLIAVRGGELRHTLDVHRNVGDLVEAELAGTVGLLPGLTLRPMYTYTHKFQDQFRGDRGFNYGELQAQTDTDFHTLELRLAYSTALLVAQQRFPVPLSLSVRYLDRVAGTNNRLVIRAFGVILTGAF